MVLANQPQRQPRHRRQVAREPRIRGTLNAQLRQAEPATNEGRRQRQPDTGRHHQRQQWRHRIADPAQQLRKQHKNQQRRQNPHHHVGVRHRIVQDIRGRPQPRQRLPRKHTAQHRRDQTDQYTQQQRRPGNRLDQMRLTRPPGLADQHPRTRAEADHQRDKEEHHRKHPRHRRQRLSAKHLADVNAVDRP